MRVCRRVPFRHESPAIAFIVVGAAAAAGKVKRRGPVEGKESARANEWHATREGGRRQTSRWLSE